jgi:ATP-dependent helicase STH1/SNF2
LEQLGAKVDKQKHENLSMKKKANSKGQNGDEINGKQEESKEDGQENEAMEDEKDVESPVNEFDEDDIPDKEKIKHNLKNGSKVYYSITHTISEEIKEQPKLLKGGELKSY